MVAKPNSIRLTSIAVRASLLGLTAFVAGCASNRLSILPASEYAALGDEAILEVENTHRVTVTLLSSAFSSELEELPAFEIVVENGGSEEILFSPANIAVRSGEQPVRSYSASELAARIREESQREADEYTGQQAEVFLQSGATRQDPSAAMANITAAKRANRAAAESSSWERRLSELAELLAPARVAPGETAGGILKLRAEDIQPNEPLRLSVAVGDESYEFAFEVQPD